MCCTLGDDEVVYSPDSRVRDILQAYSQISMPETLLDTSRFMVIRCIYRDIVTLTSISDSAASRWKYNADRGHEPEGFARQGLHAVEARGFSVHHLSNLLEK